MKLVHPVLSNRLIDKLNSFIVRYYKAATIRGLLIAGVGSLGGWFVLFLLEYFLYLPGNIRFILFLFAALLPVFLIGLWVLPPALSWLKLRKRLSYNKAAGIISSHFTELEDRLVNLLQLSELSDKSTDLSLVLAAIDQKTQLIDPFDFRQVVALKPSKSLLRITILALLVIFGAVSLRPGIVTQSPQRLFHYNQFFEKPAPFHFVLTSGNLVVYQGNDFTVLVSVEGELVPDEVHIVTSNGDFLMKKESDSDLFSFKFKEVQGTINFRFEAVSVVSQSYTLLVKQLPGITDLKILITYPGYLNRKSESIEGTGDLVVPAGSLVQWNISVKGGGLISLMGEPDFSNLTSDKADVFRFSTRANGSFRYALHLTDSKGLMVDSLSYLCQVVADQAPSIEVVQEGDTAAPELFFFSGVVRDDYGVDRLIFSIESGNSDQSPLSYPVSISASLLNQRFLYNILLDSLNLEPGVDYRAWFTVFDNNTTTGPSSSRSGIFTLRKFTREEMSEMSRQMSETSLTRLKNLKNEQNQMKEKIDNLDYKLKSQNKEEWSDKAKIKELIEQQMDSYEDVQELKKKLLKESALRDKMSDSYLDKFAQKEQELVQLMQRVLDEETLQKLHEMQQLIDSISQKDLEKRLNDLKSSLEQMEENLDRNLELYKELALQKEMFETAERLKELSKQQKELAKEMEKSMNQEEASAAQQKINDEFSDLQKQFDSLDRKNEVMKRDTLNAGFRAAEKKAEESLKKASENISKKKQSKATDNQDDAANEMENMSNELNSMLEEEEQESLEESIARMRSILQNVVESSFRQESLIQSTLQVGVSDPKYLKLGADQRMLKSGLMAMRDSLVELGKKESSIPPFLFTLFRQIDESLIAVLSNYSERKPSGINLNQRNAMTDMNNLALLLGEAMNQMQQQSNMNMMSSGSCKNSKPKKGGKGKPSLKSLRQAQEKLNQQLKEMQQKGKDKGKKGQESTQPGEQFSRMAMQQSMIRRELESYMKSVQEETGSVGAEMKKIAQEMDQTENDLVYKKITNGTMDRQEKILTRLLESERAEQEREKEQRRESKAGKLYQEGNPFQKLLYNDQKRIGEDVFIRENLKFNLFFQTKVVRYQHNTAN